MRWQQCGCGVAESTAPQALYLLLSVRAWLLPEPTVPTPHSLFVPPKRERAVDGTREKGGFGGLRSPVPPRNGGVLRRLLGAPDDLPPEHCRAVVARCILSRKTALLSPIFPVKLRKAAPGGAAVSSYGSDYFCSRLKRFLKRSTRPPVSTSFCLPV